MLPNGVDNEWIRGVVGDRSILKKSRGLLAEVPVLLTVGRNHKQKGYDLIPLVIRVLKKSAVPFVWFLVGSETEAVGRSVLESGGEDSLVCITEMSPQCSCEDGEGFRTPSRELVQLLKMADIFVSTSVFEGLPLVLLEAMAAGLPIVSTDAPGCTDLVCHGRNGLVSPVGDSLAMAANIAQLIADPQHRSRFGNEALVLASDYDWKRVVLRYEDVYRSVLG